MTVELEFYYNSEDVSNPFDVTEGTSYTMTLRNIGDTTAKNVGFYLSLSTIDPLTEIDTVYPSTRGIVIDLDDILGWGYDNPSEGFMIYQAPTWYTFTRTQGNSRDNTIPLTIGPTIANELAPDEEVSIRIMCVAPVAQPAQRKYIAINVDYTEE